MYQLPFLFISGKNTEAKMLESCDIHQDTPQAAPTNHFSFHFWAGSRETGTQVGKRKSQQWAHRTGSAVCSQGPTLGRASGTRTGPCQCHCQCSCWQQLQRSLRPAADALMPKEDRKAPDTDLCFHFNDPFLCQGAGLHHRKSFSLQIRKYFLGIQRKMTCIIPRSL